MELKNRIKIALAEKNMESKDLSIKIGIAESTISGWVTNRSQPSINKLYIVANALQVDVRTLLVPNLKDSIEPNK